MSFVVHSPHHAVQCGCGVGNAARGGDGAIDYVALAELLGVDIDPTEDPIGFTNALKAAFAEIQAKMGQAPTDEEEPDEVFMAANQFGFGHPLDIVLPDQPDSDNTLPRFTVNFNEMASPGLRRFQTTGDGLHPVERLVMLDELLNSGRSPEMAASSQRPDESDNLLSAVSGASAPQPAAPSRPLSKSAQARLQREANMDQIVSNWGWR